VAVTVAFLAWFVCIARGRMPQGFRDLLSYVLRYGAQTYGYAFLLTDRYPDSDPAQAPTSEATPEHPIRVSVDDDLRRSRLTVVFRLLLALPHLVWLVLWWLAAVVAAVASWFVTVARGRSPEPLHRFLAAFVRYETHVYAFLFLVANPFPGFTGAQGTYPVDLRVEPPRGQSRWIAGFRLVLVVPALLVASGLASALWIVGIFGWFAALVTGRMPRGLRNLGAYALRYSAQTHGYALLLTDRYPYSGPPAETRTEAAAV
jgi:hypothetical protein